MGNPCYADDFCAMCFNAAKNWQIGWYAPHKLLVDPIQGPQQVTIVGIADFVNNPDNRPVVIKVETGTATDQFIAFNRALGVNRENDEADDEVTIVETGNNGEGYSQSYLKAHLVQGESYEYLNWASSGQSLFVQVNEINISADPGYAVLSICLGGCASSCSVNVDCDDGLFCNGAETCNTSTGECIPGTPPFCDDGLFCNGVETCDETSKGCVSGTPPVCDDGNACNGVETCDSVGCVPGTPPVCDDGNACNGVEICDVSVGCIAGTNVDCLTAGPSPCGAEKVCEPSTGLCVDVGTGEDGECTLGESCDSCPNDCTVFSAGAVCGNGSCEEGEDCNSCSLDCNGVQNGPPGGRFCCTGGIGGCIRSECISGGFECTTEPANPGQACCGDGSCVVGIEDFFSCPNDCPVSDTPAPTPPPTTGNGCSSFTSGGECKAQQGCSWSAGTCIPSN